MTVHDPREDTRNDEQLLAAHIAGDSQALAALVHRYQRLLLGIVRSLAWVEPEPEVVVQNVWLRVLQSAATFHGRSTVSTWLHRITINEAINAARHRQAHRAIPTGARHETHDRADPTDTAAQVIDREHAIAVLPELLALLPRDQRLVLEVLHLDGLALGEAAELLGVAVGTIKSRAHRAHHTIRAHLTAHAGRQEFLAAWPRHLD